MGRRRRAGHQSIRLTEKLMKYKILALLVALSLNAVAAPNSFELQSCDVQSQCAVVGETGGKISYVGQANISVRLNVLSADISTTR